MNDEPRSREPATEEARIQTFLIADVRGYTLFTQQRGDEAAAKLAAKFAGIAREAVETHGGRVVELRGDEALVVFSSARQAVAAAVDLQERFVEETIDDAELPMPVGIGLDAGEAVPVEEGYRGGALNLAARLCGQAGPGEILASRGVTHLAGRVDRVRYVDRGRVHLKNLTEPVELVRVVREGDDPAERLRAALPPRPARRRSRSKIAIAAAVAVAVAASATVVLLRGEPERTIAAGTVALLSLSGDLEGTVDVGGLPRGLAQGQGSLWATDHESGQLTQVNPSTFQAEGSPIPVGHGPTGVALAAGYVWVANTDDRTVSVIDPEAHRVVETVVVGNGPAGIVADGDRVWVANSVDATVSEIDATKLHVTKTYPVGEWPVALAIGAGAVWVTNASDGTVSRVVSGQGETQPISVGRGPAAIVFAFGSLWVANAEAGTVTRFDPATLSVTGTVGAGNGPVALAAAGDGIWVASARDNTILRIDPATTQVSDTFEVGNEPRSLAGTEDGLWVGVEASPAAHRGGTLKLATKERLSIDPQNSYAAAEYTSDIVLASTYDGLARYRRTGGAAGLTVVPDLAVALPVPTPDGLTYTFTLRDGISFSNGHVLTPMDVVASFERVLVREDAGFLLPELVGSSTCRPRDPEGCDLSRGVVADEGAGTVTFHLVRPAPDFLRILAMPSFVIVPAGTPIDLDGEPVPATGPYEISDVGEARAGRYGPLVLERNPMFHEWSSDAQPDGFADRIEVMTGVDPHEQVAMIEQGEADLGLDGVPPDLMEGLERTASEQLMRSQFPALGALALNTATYPFKNLDARRALAYALDRIALNRAAAEILETFGGGAKTAEASTVTCQILPLNTPGYAPYCPHMTPDSDVIAEWAGPDMTKARELVSRSGTQGAPVSVGISPCLGPIAEVVTRTLSDLGYQVHRTTHGPLAGVPDCWFGALSRDADVSYVAWAFDYPSPGAFMVPLLSCVGPDGTPLRVSGVPSDTFNASNFCDRDIDRRMQRAIDLELTDPHASARAFEALDHDLVDLAPMIPFQTPTDVWLVSKRASNVEFSTVLIGPIVSQVWLR